MIGDVAGHVRAWWIRWIGLDDVVEISRPGHDTRIAHIRAWGRRGQTYRVGDPVPHIGGRSTYDVQTVEGAWWVNCAKGRVASWSVRPIAMTVVRVDGSLATPPSLARWAHVAARWRAAKRMR